jgi:hypothetical protein
MPEPLNLSEKRTRTSEASDLGPTGRRMEPECLSVAVSEA